MLAAAGVCVAGTGFLAFATYKRFMASMRSKGVEHLLTDEQRHELQNEHVAKMTAHSDPSSHSSSSMKARLYAMKVSDCRIHVLLQWNQALTSA